MNYLLDIERSVKSGITTYWKPNKHGYTVDINEAGEYSDNLANEIVKGDIDKRTVKIPVSVVKRLFN